MLGLALKVCGCGRFWSVDAVEDPQPQEHKETADTIKRSPPETADCLQNGVLDLPDNFRSR